jgi:hypothetical protein
MGIAEDNPARILMPCHQIREIMTNPLNAITAALPIDTLPKLCRQAMNYHDPIAQTDCPACAIARPCAAQTGQATSLRTGRARTTPAQDARGKLIPGRLPET